MNRRLTQTDRAPKAVGPYSQGVAVSGQSETFYFSGQLGIDPATGKIEGDVSQQATQVLKNIAAVLETNGMNASNVIKTLIFLVDMKDFAAVNTEYSKFFTENYPARSCVAVQALPLGGLVEIEVIAMK